MTTPPLYSLAGIRSRSSSAENPKALPGAGGQAGGGRKGRPCHWPFPSGETLTLVDVEGPGIIRHLWFTLPPPEKHVLRHLILRAYWDGQAEPSVEVPLGDFFGVAHGVQVVMEGTPVGMQDGRGFNCWIAMPFRKHAKLTLENDSGEEVRVLFYQVDFTLGDPLPEPDSLAYFHAQFRRANPCPLGQDYAILDGIEQPGVYLGTVLGTRSLYAGGWWGEGEVKFYLDGDTDLPTICGTGTEDYMGSAWGLERVVTPYQGAPYVDKKQGYYSIYRFHIADPIYFQRLSRVTVQQLGWGNIEKAKAHYGEGFKGYPGSAVPADCDSSIFERSDDWSSVAYWYQQLPTAPFPVLPNRAAREADLPLNRPGFGRRDED